MQGHNNKKQLADIKEELDVLKQQIEEFSNEKNEKKSIFRNDDTLPQDNIKRIFEEYLEKINKKNKRKFGVSNP